MDKSLKRTSQLTRQRSVLSRAERIAQLMKEERWTETSRPLGLPKVKVVRAIIKKAKKAAAEGEVVEGAPAEGAAVPAAAPAAGAKAPATGAKAPAGKAAPAAKPAAAGKTPARPGK